MNTQQINQTAELYKEVQSLDTFLDRLQEEQEFEAMEIDLELMGAY